MKNSICFISLFFSIFFVISCQQKLDVLPVITINHLNSQNEIPINNWQIVGPFSTRDTDLNKGVSGYNRDDLINFETNEASITPDIFAGIQKQNAINKHNIPSIFVNEIIHITGESHREKFIFSEDATGNLYAACIIESPMELDVAFLTKVGKTLFESKIKIWLNNELLSTQDATSYMMKILDYTPAHLRKGKNFLLVKVDNRGGGWDFSFNISSVKYARDRYREHGGSNFLDKSIIKIGEKIGINLGLFKTEKSVTIQILDAEQNIIRDEKVEFNDHWSISIDQLSIGFYYCRVLFLSESFQQQFYYGNDIGKKFSDYEKRIRFLNIIDDQTQINMDALIYRYDHLLNAEIFGTWNAHRERRAQKSLVYTAMEIETILKNLEDSKEGFKNYPGRHLRGFRSKIDNQIQHYLVYAPNKIVNTTEPMPLLIRTPAHADIVRPFLESVQVANVTEIERFEKEAERNGFIILVPSAREYAELNINPISMTDIFEAIDAVKKDYTIDDDKIYIFGECSASRKTLLLAERYPSRFAAISFYQFLVDLPHYFRAPNTWKEANKPINFIENLSNMPIKIIQDRSPNAPVEQLLKFNEEAERKGITADFTILDGSPQDLYAADSLSQVLAFFKDKVKIKSPQTVQFSTSQLKYDSAYWIKINRIIPLTKATIKASISPDNVVTVEAENIYQYEILLENLNYDKTKNISVLTNSEQNFNGLPTTNSIIINVSNEDNNPANIYVKNNVIEGPILDAFSDNFIIVEGTLGTENNRKNSKNLINEFKKTWQDNYYSTPKFKLDRQVKNFDIENSHLILFGNQNTNIIIKKIIDKIPLKIETNRIVLGSRKYKGSNLGVHLIYPNPLNPEKYVLILGTNNMDNFQIREKNLALNGWSDYEIWKYYESNLSGIIDAGYFDSHWQLPEKTF